MSGRAPEEEVGSEGRRMEGRRRLDSLRIAPEDVFRESVKNTGPGSDSQPSSSAEGWLRSDEDRAGIGLGSGSTRAGQRGR